MSTTVGILTPVAAAAFAFLGALIGQWWSRRSARELDHWRRREETMRMLRWSVELAADDHALRSKAGLRTLTGLTESELLQSEDKHLVQGLTSMFLATPLGDYTEDRALTIVEGEPDVDD
jgi:hypothetical protein